MERNKIYKGDCYELLKAIPDKSIDLIYSDLPYLIKGLSKKKTGVFIFQIPIRKI